MTGEGEVCQNVGNYSSSGFNYDVRIMRDLGFFTAVWFSLVCLTCSKFIISDY